MTKRCMWRNRNLSRCGRVGDWKFFCEEHKHQWPFLLSFLIFTAGGGLASIVGVLPKFDWGVKTIEVKGDNGIEKALNQAELEGVYHKKSSSEYVISKVVVRSDVSADIEGFPNHFMFVSVSPFKPTNMENTFEAGDCRFLGVGKIFNKDTSMANIDIQTISCVDNMRNAFILSSDEGNVYRVGSIASINNISNEGIQVIEEDKMLTLPAGDNVLVKFDRPVTELKKIGSSNEKW